MITLTTDFGLRDPFVGVIKGVVLSISPGAEIVDLTHGIPPQDVRSAAFVIADSFRHFPRGTVHVIVVDPKVGTDRRAIAASAHGQRFVAPDNGVLTGVLASDPRSRVFYLDKREYFLDGAGGTFDGRDVFAPVAAWLDKGKDLGDMGTEINDPVLLDLPSPELAGYELRGEVIYIDSFGNAFTNIRPSDLEGLGRGPYNIEAKGAETGIVTCYSEGDCNVLKALINSSGLLELFLDQASAAGSLGITIGEPVTARQA